MHETLVYRILCGYQKFTIEDKIGRSFEIKLRDPNVEDLFEAQEIYEETYKAALSDGLFDDTQYLYYIQDKGWTSEEEQEIADCPKLIEDLKVALHDAVGKSTSQATLRKRLQETREQIALLFNKKYRHNYMSADGVASMARSYYLISRTASPIFPSFNEPNLILDAILDFKNSTKIDEETFRAIARNDPWRGYWSVGDPFGKPSIELTEEQRNLVMISKMYDNIHESPECPPDEVLNDDDCLDGWLIKQKRKRETSQNEQALTQGINPAVAKHDMIFLPAETAKDAERIDNLNNPVAKMIKKQRLDLIKQKGSMNEEEFPDARLKIFNSKEK